MSRYPIVKLDAQGRKKCPVCKQFKKLNEFPSQAGSRLGVHSYCSTCLNAYRRTRYTAERGHRWNVQKNYHLTKEQYEAMLASQGGVCACCGKSETIIYKRTGKAHQLSVDHNHETNVVRGLLCRSCNLFVWHIENDPKRLEAVLAYLAKHPPEAK